MNRRHGHVLLWGGFLGGSLTALYRGTDIPWAWFVGWMALGVLGVIILRATSGHAAAHEHKVSADVETMRRSLAAVGDVLAGLIEAKDDSDVYDIHGAIDDRLVADLAAFADARESMIPRFGLDAYAEIMSRFAGGERMINRAWSASADGYVDEVWICLGRARVLMSDARRLFDDQDARSD